MKKITKATVKSFIRKNINELYVKTISDFNGMTDCIEQVENNFKKVVGNLDFKCENTLGLNEVWFVNGSGDRFAEYSTDDFCGYITSNCCGSWIVAIKKSV